MFTRAHAPSPTSGGRVTAVEGKAAEAPSFDSVVMTVSSVVLRAGASTTAAAEEVEDKEGSSAGRLLLASAIFVALRVRFNGIFAASIVECKLNEVTFWYHDRHMYEWECMWRERFELKK